MLSRDYRPEALLGKSDCQQARQGSSAGHPASPGLPAESAFSSLTGIRNKPTLPAASASRGIAFIFESKAAGLHRRGQFGLNSAVGGRTNGTTGLSRVTTKTHGHSGLASEVILTAWSDNQCFRWDTLSDAGFKDLSLRLPRGGPCQRATAIGASLLKRSRDTRAAGDARAGPIGAAMPAPRVRPTRPLRRRRCRSGQRRRTRRPHWRVAPADASTRFPIVRWSADFPPPRTPTVRR